MATEFLGTGHDDGTSLGHSTTAKISFYGVAPVVQQAAITAAPAGGTGATEGAYDTSTNRNTMISTVNSIITTLETFGLVAAN